MLPGGYAFHKFSIQFTTFHNSSQLFTTLFSLVGEALKRRHLHFRNPYGQWWGQFAEMDKFSSFPHITQYTGTQVHHITFYLVNPSVPLNGWVTTPPKKKAHKKKNQFTTFHNFSQFFTTFHQPSQFCSGFRVVKICENLSHFHTLKSRGVTGSLAKNQKKRTPRECFFGFESFRECFFFFLRRVFAINRDKIRD